MNSNKDDSKSSKAMRTIGEVASLLKIEHHVLRFWEKKFPQIKPIKSRGRRYYRPEDIEVLENIKELLYVKGFTIKGAVKHISKNKTDNKQNNIEDNTSEDNLNSGKIDSIISKLSKAKSELQEAID